MSLWSARPGVGDWVRTSGRRRIPVTLADHLLDGGVRPGSRGVVVGRIGGRSTVDFGSQRATIPTSHLRVVRRGGGLDAFHRRASVIGWARFGVAVAILGPFAVYALRYVVANHTTQGLLPSLAVGVIDSFIDVIGMALRSPLQTALYLLILAGLSRFAFGHR